MNNRVSVAVVLLSVAFVMAGNPHIEEVKVGEDIVERKISKAKFFPINHTAEFQSLNTSEVESRHLLKDVACVKYQKELVQIDIVEGRWKKVRQEYRCFGEINVTKSKFTLYGFHW